MTNLYTSWSKLILLLSMILMFLGLMMLKSEWALMFQFNFIQIKSCKMEMFIIFDWIALIFASAVLFISSMVILFSNEYMENETFKTRFLMLILMFVLSMFLLILSPNLMSILLGWDGLGLVSYCLVIYYQNPRSYNAGMLTVLSNRIGDILILISIALILTTGTWNMISLNYTPLSFMIMLFIMMAAMTKSAQIPFSAWLPAAMAAPTPVSALVHSSTLVTAGVFLMIRFHNIFTNNLISTIMLTLSCLTMLMAGIGATLETDMKKIIALSTLSQLAIMMMALSLNMWLLAYFHMITHAMFKALLFLCAGYIIHNTKNNQDIRKMGSLILSSPMISTAMLIASLALMGFPFLAGFYSKDLILEKSMNSTFMLFTMILIFISFGMTMMYSFRLPFMSLISEFQTPKTILMEETKNMKNSIFNLSLMAVITGAMMSWIILPSPPSIVLDTPTKLTSMILITVGISISYALWVMKSNFYSTKTINKMFLGSMWFLPTISTILMTKTLLKMNSLKPAESGWSEMFGAQGIHNSINMKSSMISKLQKNETQMFMASFLMFSIILLMIYPT